MGDTKMTTGRTGKGADAWAEKLRADALEELTGIDQDRETVRLIEAGWDDQRIAEHLNWRLGWVQSIRNRLANGEEVCPVTPHELGLRRAVGQITTQEMMEQLRAWPYTFGKLHHDFYDRGSWDDVVGLAMVGQLTDDEYEELQLLAEQLPDYPHD